ncbi:CPBP family intramembrane glutamic endopeptidase [Nocardioides nematodiphilus]|uniref:CPBP family intramembrane glutamic endopeptidase n=1 Tax=Nocardioides nematodiphilus TaxID=2849669 RepID=UPI001CDA0057|nr:type II CAAX endopeptidase family protein [Nocardioides nematodiphilus]MCA1981290.1 CPBP family intramembrane metalloprotease [Nocardioides nematodiphilus]
MGAVLSWLRRSLWETVPRDHRESRARLRRRQWVTAIFALLGAVVLGVTLRIEPGSPWFYPATLALAAVWVGGAFASGPLHLGRIGTRRGAGHGPDRALGRPLLAPAVVGLGLAGVFTVGALVVREIPYLGDRVAGVLDYTGEGSLPILIGVASLNGVAEELFFRGALYAAVTRRPVLWTTLAYTAVTLATGNVMLALAAAILGVVVGLERRASGGILAPVVTHVSWSLIMLLVLPPLFG